MTQPSLLYQEKIQRGEIEDNPAQRDILTVLDTLTIALQKPRWLQRLTRKQHGLYLYGSVGCGKTTLIDLWLACMPQKRVWRIHFHDFMDTIYQSLQAQQGQKNPLSRVIRTLAQQYDMLFVDEFLVHDIGHATILQHILTHSVRYGLFLITTANDAPENAYKGRINPSAFTPAIDCIYRYFSVSSLDSDIDYRHTSYTDDHHFFHPITATTQQLMSNRFDQDNHHKMVSTTITIHNRPVDVIAMGDNRIWFDWVALLSPPRNHRDFLYLCAEYPTIFISDLQIISPRRIPFAINLCHLVDIAYEQNTLLVITSHCGITDIFRHHPHLAGVARCVSRLKAMQTRTK
jgi:cell division protein ZapE